MVKILVTMSVSPLPSGVGSVNGHIVISAAHTAFMDRRLLWPRSANRNNRNNAYNVNNSGDWNNNNTGNSNNAVAPGFIDFRKYVGIQTKESSVLYTAAGLAPAASFIRRK